MERRSTTIRYRDQRARREERRSACDGLDGHRGCQATSTTLHAARATDVGVRENAHPAGAHHVVAW